MQFNTTTDNFVASPDKRIVSDTLPNKPSELLQLALKDFKKFKRKQHASIDMSSYLDFESDGHCSACLAGTVMFYELQGKERYNRLRKKAEEIYPKYNRDTSFISNGTVMGVIEDNLYYAQSVQNKINFISAVALHDYSFNSIYGDWIAFEDLQTVRDVIRTTVGRTYTEANPSGWLKYMRAVIKNLRAKGL